MDREVIANALQSPAVRIFHDLEREGFRIGLTSCGSLAIAPQSKLTPERRDAITCWKDALRVLVEIAYDAGVQARRNEFHMQMQSVPAPRVPPFLFRNGIAYVPGVCFSCGDHLPYQRYGRCWRCSLAWRLACRGAVPLAIADALDTARIT